MATSGIPSSYGRRTVSPNKQSELYRTLRTPDEEENWCSRIGDRVLVAGVKMGTLMFFGRTHFADGLWCGIELDDPDGRHDGTLENVTYFKCRQMHGIFTPISKVKLLAGTEVTSSTNATFVLSPSKGPEEVFERMATQKLQSNLPRPRKLVAPSESSSPREESNKLNRNSTFSLKTPPADFQQRWSYGGKRDVAEDAGPKHRRYSLSSTISNDAFDNNTFVSKTLTGDSSGMTTSKTLSPSAMLDGKVDDSFSFGLLSDTQLNCTFGLTGSTPLFDLVKSAKSKSTVVPNDTFVSSPKIPDTCVNFSTQHQSSLSTAKTFCLTPENENGLVEQNAVQKTSTPFLLDLVPNISEIPTPVADPDLSYFPSWNFESPVAAKPRPNPLDQLDSSFIIPNLQKINVSESLIESGTHDSVTFDFATTKSATTEDPTDLKNTNFSTPILKTRKKSDSIKTVLTFADLSPITDREVDNTTYIEPVLSQQHSQRHPQQYISKNSETTTFQTTTCPSLSFGLMKAAIQMAESLSESVVVESIKQINEVTSKKSITQQQQLPMSMQLTISVTSIDTGYQGDGEDVPSTTTSAINTPVEDEKKIVPDDNPMTTSDNPILTCIRRQHPQKDVVSTDSDFCSDMGTSWTESEIEFDGSDKSRCPPAILGGRNARVIDGTLYFNDINVNDSTVVIDTVLPSLNCNGVDVLQHVATASTVNVAEVATVTPDVMTRCTDVAASETVIASSNNDTFVVTKDANHGITDDKQVIDDHSNKTEIVDNVTTDTTPNEVGNSNNLDSSSRLSDTFNLPDLQAVNTKAIESSSTMSLSSATSPNSTTNSVKLNSSVNNNGINSNNNKFKEPQQTPKKYKMPKKNVVSKIKMMIESSPVAADNSNLSAASSVDAPTPPRTPRQPKKSRWDAVMSKIAAGKEEEKTKCKTKKEIKGKVSSTWSTPPPVPSSNRSAKKENDSSTSNRRISRMSTKNSSHSVDSDDNSRQQQTIHSNRSSRSDLSTATTKSRLPRKLSTSSSIAAARPPSPSQLSDASSSAMSVASSRASCASSGLMQTFKQSPKIPSSLALRGSKVNTKVCANNNNSKSSVNNSNNKPTPTARSKISRASTAVASSTNGTKPSATSNAVATRATSATTTGGSSNVATRRSIAGKPPVPSRMVAPVRAAVSVAAPSTTSPAAPKRVPPARVSSSGASSLRAKEQTRLKNNVNKSPLPASSGHLLNNGGHQLDLLNSPPITSREIARLQSVCEEKTSEIAQLTTQLSQRTTAFEALTIVVKYMNEELDAFSHPHLIKDMRRLNCELQKTKTEAETTLRVKNDLEVQLTENESKYKDEIERLKEIQVSELHDVRTSLEADHQKRLDEVTCTYKESEVSLRLSHKQQVELLEERHAKTLEDEQQSRNNEVNELNETHRKATEDLKLEYEGEVKRLTEKFSAEKTELDEKIKSLTSQCYELQQQKIEFEEVILKDSDLRMQLAASKIDELRKEVDSLKTVLELKTKEMHDLRFDSQNLFKVKEKLYHAREQVKILTARNEDLQEQVDKKNQQERLLSTEREVLRDHYEKESRASKRLSMEKEQLEWKLKQSMEGSILSSSSFVGGNGPYTGEGDSQTNGRHLTSSPLSKMSPVSPFKGMGSPIMVTGNRRHQRYSMCEDPSADDDLPSPGGRYRRAASLSWTADMSSYYGPLKEASLEESSTPSECPSVSETSTLKPSVVEMSSSSERTLDQTELSEDATLTNVTRLSPAVGNGDIVNYEDVQLRNLSYSSSPVTTMPKIHNTRPKFERSLSNCSTSSADVRVPSLITIQHLEESSRPNSAPSSRLERRDSLKRIKMNNPAIAILPDSVLNRPRGGSCSPRTPSRSFRASPVKRSMTAPIPQKSPEKCSTIENKLPVRDEEDVKMVDNDNSASVQLIQCFDVVVSPVSNELSNNESNHDFSNNDMSNNDLSNIDTNTDNDNSESSKQLSTDFPVNDSPLCPPMEEDTMEDTIERDYQVLCATGHSDSPLSTPDPFLLNDVLLTSDDMLTDVNPADNKSRQVLKVESSSPGSSCSSSPQPNAARVTQLLHTSSSSSSSSADSSSDEEEISPVVSPLYPKSPCDEEPIESSPLGYFMSPRTSAGEAMVMDDMPNQPIMRPTAPSDRNTHSHRVLLHDVLLQDCAAAAVEMNGGVAASDTLATGGVKDSSSEDASQQGVSKPDTPESSSQAVAPTDSTNIDLTWSDDDLPSESEV